VLMVLVGILVVHDVMRGILY